MTVDIWRTKLAAWLHDPAEKALILLRDKTGHEKGTVAALRQKLGIAKEDFPERADHYAAAADRPQFPREREDGPYVSWTQVDFAERPVLIHPLTGQNFDLKTLKENLPALFKAVSLDHFEKLIVYDENNRPALRSTLLAFWRFGPETPAVELHHLWQNLPADTRVPDHSIWAHLDIVSAFAGAMAADANGTPALLAVSFGPVQSFIAEARTTSDLWAGSHLLARIAWEGMKVICEEYGPDAVLFPNLRGVPMVDAWLYKKLDVDANLRQRFEQMDWFKWKSDANPLFAAALPNRFVALVPADRAKAIAERIKERVRKFMADLGRRTLEELLNAISEPWRDDLPCVRQMEEQLRGFPEVHWAAVPWALAEAGGKPDEVNLRSALQQFYPLNDKVGFLDGPVWEVLQRDIDLEGAKFYAPNPGVLYPALYDLLDRVSAAAKSLRLFDPLRQEGYRSSLNGEREWLTLANEVPDDIRPSDLPKGVRYIDLPSGRRGDKPGQVPTLWTRVASKPPSWAKKGEHLDALTAIKRLWPTLFLDEVRGIVGPEVQRYVVSTHTLALAVSLERWLDNPKDIPLKLRNLLESQPAERAALPRRLISKLRNHADGDLLCRKLPGVLDALKESDDPQAEEMLRTAESEIKTLFGAKPETYYGILLLDGDRMGAWLSGGKGSHPLTYSECWHPQVRASVERKFANNETLKAYLTAMRPPSPSRHRAISEALNHFSLKVARFVVEDCFKGKLIYSGGDDVLAFVCVDDLLPAMTMLRYLYSGLALPEWIVKLVRKANPKWVDPKSDELTKFKCGNGYLRLDAELLLTMGEKAEASCGAVVAHHQTPLGFVLRELRRAESAAKNDGGRNAFCLRVLKRAGGEIGITDKWFRKDEGSNAPELLASLRDMLANPDVSRRAAYHSLEWLRQLPPKPEADMLTANLAYQFERQGAEKAGRTLACELAAYADKHFEKPAERLMHMLMVAEFLARESRLESQKMTMAEEAA